jgi:hypothetical protein
MMRLPLVSLISGVAALFALINPKASGDEADIAARRDRTKLLLRAPTKSVLAGTRETQNAPSPSVERRPSGGQLDNPKVQPGKVRWHPTMAAACAAARRSGKPVFLFQMMGNLDERFC